MVAVQALAAVRAVRHRRGHLAAVVVDEQRRRAVGRRVPVAPDAQRVEHRREVGALAGEHVLVARRVVLVLASLEDPLLDERVEPGAEHVAGDAEAPLPVVEAGDAEERVAQDQQRPPLADHLEGLGDGAVTSPRTRSASCPPAYQLHDTTDSV